MPDKYQQEIEEILKQAGELKGTAQRQKSRQSTWRLTWLYFVQSLGGKAWSLQPGRVMLIAVCLLLAALIFSRMIPGLGGLWPWRACCSL